MPSTDNVMIIDKENPETVSQVSGADCDSNVGSFTALRVDLDNAADTFDTFRKPALNLKPVTVISKTVAVVSDVDVGLTNTQFREERDLVRRGVFHCVGSGPREPLRCLPRD